MLKGKNTTEDREELVDPMCIKKIREREHLDKN